MTWLTKAELENLGFRSIGKNVLIDHQCLIIDPSRVAIDDSSRIDAFSVLSPGSGSIRIGKNVHIGHGARIYGSGKVTIGDGSTISSGTSVFSASDDYTGGHLVNPTVPNHLRSVHLEEVVIEEHVVVGSNSVILPGVKIATGAAVGALSLVKDQIEEFQIVAGIPARVLGERNRQIFADKSEEFKGYLDEDRRGNQSK